MSVTLTSRPLTAAGPVGRFGWAVLHGIDRSTARARSSNAIKIGFDIGARGTKQPATIIAVANANLPSGAGSNTSATGPRGARWAMTTRGGTWWRRSNAILPQLVDRTKRALIGPSMRPPS